MPSVGLGIPSGIPRGPSGIIPIPWLVAPCALRGIKPSGTPPWERGTVLGGAAKGREGGARKEGGAGKARGGGKVGGGGAYLGACGGGVFDLGTSAIFGRVPVCEVVVRILCKKRRAGEKERQAMTKFYTY